MDDGFDVIIDIEDIFNIVIEKNPELTPEQRVRVWEIIEKTIDDMAKEAERVTCLNV